MLLRAMVSRLSAVAKYGERIEKTARRRCSRARGEPRARRSAGERRASSPTLAGSELIVIDVLGREHRRLAKQQDAGLGVIGDGMAHAFRRRGCGDLLSVDQLLACPYGEIAELLRIPKHAVSERAALEVGARGVRAAIARSDHLTDLAGRLDGLSDARARGGGDADQALEVGIGRHEVDCDLRGEDLTSNRYLVGVIYAAAALVPMLGLRSLLLRVIVTAGATLYAFAGCLALAQERIGPPASPTDAVAAEVANIAKAEHMSIGYAGYWDASPITWATHFRVKVFPVGNCGNQRLCGFELAIDTAWYTPRPRIRTFLLVDPAYSAAYPLSPTPDLGQPIAAHQIGNITMYVYPYDIASRLYAL